MEKAALSAAEVTVLDRFAALTWGFEVDLGECARAGYFLQEGREVRQLLFAYAATYKDVLAGEFGLRTSDAIIASINQDFVDVAKVVRGVAAVIKSLFPYSPPMLGQSVPDCPPPEFPRTRSATDRIRGEQNKALTCFPRRCPLTRKT